MTKKSVKSYIFDCEFSSVLSGWDRKSVEDDYRRWNSLKNKLVGEVDRYEMEDFITGAKRLVNHRTQKLFLLYDLKKNLKQLSKKGDFYLLEELDIARPYLLDKLRVIRNQVEHQFQLTVDSSFCQDYLDICWYFLRSTDYFFLHTSGELENDGAEEAKSKVFNIRFDQRTKMLSFTGKIHEDDIFDTPQEGCAEIEIQTQERFYPEIKLSSQIQAKIVGSEEVLLNIFRKFFNVIGII